MERLLKRDNTTYEKVEAIMKNQWSDEEKIKLSDYVITNTQLEKTINQVSEIHIKILKAIN